MKKKLIFATAIVCFNLLFACKKGPTKPPGCSSCTTCVSNVLPVDSVGLVFNAGHLLSTAYARQDSFYAKNNVVTYGKVMRTTIGYYGGSGLSVYVNLDSLMPNNLPKEFHFTHARLVGNTEPDSTLINLQLPGTPLIITTSDSIPFYCSQFGYAATVYSYQSSIPFLGTISQAVIADSIVIKGNNPIHECVIGANLFESELRNICFKK